MPADRNCNTAVPRLSIIVATYQCATSLQDCIDSIAAQTSRDWELLVADGGSTDATLDVIRGNTAHLSYWHSHPDAGIYDAWNQALVHARGEYVCFLGADDAWNSADALERIFTAMNGCEYDLVTSRGLLIDSRGRTLHEFGRPWDYRRVMKRMTICHPGALHRRDLFDRFGLFDVSYRICADYSFLLRLPPDLRSLHLDLPLVKVADGGISRNRRMLMLRERCRAQATCPHVGPLRARLNYLDKLWRIPVARVLGIPN